MIYKIAVNSSRITESLSKLGVNLESEKQFYFIEADDPDEACHQALNKIKTKIISNKLNDEIVDFVEDELHNEIRITKLTRVRPHA